jgi:hypothetical protein
MAEASHVKVVPASERYEKMESAEIALAMADAEGWLPKEGDEISGVVIGIRMGRSEYKAKEGKNPAYPIVFILPENSDKAKAVHCFHAVLENEIKSARPLPGEHIFIKHLGKGKAKPGNNPPERYAVHVERDNATNDPYAAMD